MARSTLLEYEKLLKMERAEIDREVEKVFGITEQELSYIRQPQDHLDCAYRAGEWLKEHGHRNQLTIWTIGALGSYKPLKAATGAIFKRIKNGFYNDRIQRETEQQFSIPYMQFFRESIGAYDGNLYEARRVWRNFQPNPTDWLVGTRIPLYMGLDESRLVGFYRGGVLEGFGLSVWGDRDEGMLLELIAKETGRIHNIQIPVYTASFKGEMPWAGKTYPTKLPRISIYSKAITTWLVDDLGFPSISNLQLTEGQTRGLVSGTLAIKGRVNIKPDAKNLDSIHFSHDDTLNVLLKRLGLNPHQSKYGDYLYPKDMKQVLDMGLICSPAHIEKLKGYFAK